MQEATVLFISSSFNVSLGALWRDTWVCGFIEDVQHSWSLYVTSQTKYPSLRSSGVMAVLLMLPPGLGPPPRVEAEWTVLKSREVGGLEGRMPAEETAEAEALDPSGCPPGSMTVLMTGRKNRKCSFYLIIWVFNTKVFRRFMILI